MFQVSSDIDKRVIRFAGRGMWDAEALAGFHAAMLVEARRFRALGLPFDIVADLSDYPAQLQEIAGGNEDMMAQVRGMGARRGAVVVQNAITKLQATRITKRKETVRFFESEAEGMVWLESFADR